MKNYFKDALTRYEDAMALAGEVAPETINRGEQLSRHDLEIQKKLRSVYEKIPEDDGEAHSEASDINSLKRGRELWENNIVHVKWADSLLNKHDILPLMQKTLDQEIKKRSEQPGFEDNQKAQNLVKRLKSEKIIVDAVSVVVATVKEKGEKAVEKLTDFGLTVAEKLLVKEDEVGKKSWEVIKATVTADQPLRKIPVCIATLGGLLLEDRYGPDYDLNTPMTAFDMKLYIFFNRRVVEGTTLVDGVANDTLDTKESLHSKNGRK
jgi:hypothetical protein